MKTKSLLSILALGLLAGAGCTTRFVDFTLISTKNVDLSKAATFRRGTSRTEADDKSYIIIFIPTGTPNLKEAIDRAIEKVPGAVALLDGVVSQGGFYIPYIYGEAWFTVEGTPLVDPALAACSPAATPYMIVTIEQTGQSAALNYVTKTQFESVKQGIISGAASNLMN